MKLSEEETIGTENLLRSMFASALETYNAYNNGCMMKVLTGRSSIKRQEFLNQLEMIDGGWFEYIYYEVFNLASVVLNIGSFGQVFIEVQRRVFINLTDGCSLKHLALVALLETIGKAHQQESENLMCCKYPHQAHPSKNPFHINPIHNYYECRWKCLSWKRIIEDGISQQPLPTELKMDLHTTFQWMAWVQYGC